MGRLSVLSQLVLAIFRVGVHEGALVNTREVSLVAQCARNHSADPRTQLQWLERHSPRALGFVRDGSPNEWSARLTATCDPPWVFEPQWWFVTRWSRCLAAFHLADAIVRGRVRDEPCEGAPTTWGGREPGAHAESLRQGMQVHRCVGVRNEGWSWPGLVFASAQR